MLLGKTKLNFSQKRVQALWTRIRDGIFMKAIAAVAAILLAGCASQIMSKYVGKPISEIVADYGMPAGAYDVEIGKRAFVWQMDSTVIVPGTSFTNASVIGNQVFANTYTSPDYASTSRCSYVMFATRTRTDIEGPAAWTVSGFRKPRLDCE